MSQIAPIGAPAGSGGILHSLCEKIASLISRVFNAFKRLFCGEPLAPGANLMTNEIIPFYEGRMQNNRGLTIAQVINRDDNTLESDHFYIQWLFPLETRSGPNPTAPLLNRAIIQQFRGSLALKNQMLAAFKRMLQFYGLRVEEGNVVRDVNFAQRSGVWLTPDNHNFLRITRIIKCLKMVGLEAHSQAFYRAMDAIYRNEGSHVISPQTYAIWTNAAR